MRGWKGTGGSGNGEKRRTAVDLVKRGKKKKHGKTQKKHGKKRAHGFADALGLRCVFWARERDAPWLSWFVRLESVRHWEYDWYSFVSGSTPNQYLDSRELVAALVQ